MSAKNSNSGRINVEAVEKSILANGGGQSSRPNADGSTHVTTYSRDSDRHISVNKYPNGEMKEIHTDKDGKANMNYPNWR